MLLGSPRRLASFTMVSAGCNRASRTTRSSFSRHLRLGLGRLGARDLSFNPAKQHEMVYDDLSAQEQQYDYLASIINKVRHEVDLWRKSPQSEWCVTPETARLLKHWRHYEFNSYRPFFCLVEAGETVIWLTEVAPKLDKRERSS